MILQNEIINLAEQSGVPKFTIDKDWVLGHFLNAFYGIPENREKFVFKGGTCIRKCHIPDYRFSEDLDFTLTDPEFVVEKQWLKSIIEKVTKTSGILFQIESIHEQVFKDALQGYLVKLKYWGADHNPNQAPLPHQRWQTFVKLDFSFTEEIVTPIENFPIVHPYSDKDAITTEVPAYSIVEIFSEKIRAFFQRSYPAPRDYYDVWFLCNYYPDLNWVQINNVLEKKFKVKNKKYDQSIFSNQKLIKKVEQAWMPSLGNHLKAQNLPDAHTVFEYIDEILSLNIKLD